MSSIRYTTNIPARAHPSTLAMSNATNTVSVTPAVEEPTPVEPRSASGRLSAWVGQRRRAED